MTNMKSTKHKVPFPKKTIPVHLRVIRCTELSAKARCLFMVMWERKWFNLHSGSTKPIYFSQIYLGKVIGGGSPNTVSKYLNELIEKKMIEKKKRFGTTDLYRVRSAKKWLISENPANPVAEIAASNFDWDRPTLEIADESLKSNRSPHQNMRTSKHLLKQSLKQKRKIIASNELKSLEKDILKLLHNSEVKKIPDLTRRACASMGSKAHNLIIKVISTTDQFFSLKGDAEDYRKLTLQLCNKAADIGLKDFRKKDSSKDYVSPIGRSDLIESAILKQAKIQ